MIYLKPLKDGSKLLTASVNTDNIAVCDYHNYNNFNENTDIYK